GTMDQPTQITSAVAHHAEGPCWSPTWGGLRWVDMLAGDLLTLDTAGEITRLPVGSPVAAFVRPRSRGGYVVGTERGLALAGDSDEVPTPWLELWSDPGIRLNEGGCDPWGNLYAGGMPYVKVEGAAQLFRITPAGEVTVVESQVTTSNGIDFSPDGSLAYYNDTQTEQTDVYDAAPEGLTGRRRFHLADGGRVDGLTVDSAGNVWVAMNRVGAVRCYSPDAEILEELRLPVQLVTAVTLGGPDLRDLFITTSRELPDPEPGAGAVFHTQVDIPGKPVLPFGG
ncbi:MAG: SMP-30/gluconolactonase/LRE family protein, partial [Propioniciclava sp.]